MNNMINETCTTFWARIYIAGPKHKAENICREYVEKGACVTVTKTNYIFKYGEQSGVIVEFINYPRFPKPNGTIFMMAKELGLKLMYKMNQGSFTVQTPNETIYFDRRDD